MSVLLIAIGAYLAGSQLVATYPWQAGFLLGLILIAVGVSGVVARGDER